MFPAFGDAGFGGKLAQLLRLGRFTKVMPVASDATSLEPTTHVKRVKTPPGENIPPAGSRAEQ